MKVVYHVSQSGRNPVKRFLDTLDQRTQRKALQILTLLKNYGLSPAIPNLKKLSGTPLWEIRMIGKSQVRILYALPVGDTLLVLHGFVKKSSQTPQREIHTALQRLHDWLGQAKSIITTQAIHFIPNMV